MFPFLMDDFDIFAFPTHHHRVHFPHTSFVKHPFVHHGENQSKKIPTVKNRLIAVIGSLASPLRASTCLHTTLLRTRPLLRARTLQCARTLQRAPQETPISLVVNATVRLKQLCQRRKTPCQRWLLMISPQIEISPQSIVLPGATPGQIMHCRSSSGVAELMDNANKEMRP